MPEVADLWVSLRAVTAPFTEALVAAGTEAERAALQFKALQTEVSAASTRMTRFATRTDAAATALVRLSAESEGATTGLAGSSAESLRASELFATLETAVTTTGERLAALGASADSAAAGLAATSAESRTAAASLQAAASSAGEAGVAVEGLGAKSAAMGGAIGSAAKWGSLAIAGIGVVSVAMASKFDAVMTQLNTQAGVSKDKLGGLKDGVLQLAAQVGFSPDSLAEALFHVESNFESMGITSKKALELTKIAAEGAAVGHADLVDVTNALTAAVASGIPGVENMSQAMGMLNAVVGSGDMKMQDLANAFGSGMVATVKGFGLSLTDVGAALATFGDNNIRGANAGTQLRMSVMALANPIKGSEAALHTLGITQTTLAEDMQKGGLKLALEDLVDRMKKAGISADEQGQIITEAFGRKAGAGLNVLVDQVDRFESKFPAIEEGAGKFADAWTTTTQTLRQQLRDIEFGFEALGIKVGEFLIPAVSKSITAVEAYGKRAVKDLVDLWAIYGPAVKDKLSSASGSVRTGVQALLAPVQTEFTNIAIKAIPLAVTAVDKFKSKLREVQNDAKPAVDGLHAMYESAVSSGGALDTFGQRVKAGATVLAGLGVGLGSATSLLRPLGQIVGDLAHAFSELPGPIQLSAVAMLAMRPFRPQIQAMQESVVGFGRAGVTAFRGIGDSILYQRVLAAGAGQELGRFGGAIAAIEARSPTFSAMATSFRNTASSIEQAGGRMVGLRSTVGGLATALGTGAGAGLMGAFKGLWGFLGGPWGVAIAGAMMGLDMLAKRQQQAAAAAEAHRQRVSSLADALKSSRGSIDESVRATAVQTLADTKLKDGKTQLLDVMHKAGIDANTLTNAYMGQSGGVDLLRQQLAAAAQQNQTWIASGRSSIQVYTEHGQVLKNAADALGSLSGELPDAIQRNKELTDAVKGGGTAADSATSFTGRLRLAIDTLAGSEATADEKTSALHQSLQLLSGGSLDVQAAIATQNGSLIELNKSWQDGVDQAKGYGAALLVAGGGLNTATENGQALFAKLQSLRDQTADAALATYDFAKANGATVPQALKQAEGAMQSSWDAAVTTGQKFGLTADQANNLATQMGLIPSNLAITLAVKDLDPTKQAMLYVQGLADHLKQGAKVTVSAMTDDAINALRSVGVTVNQLPDKRVEITAPNGEALAKINEVINRTIPTKYVSIVPSFSSRFLDAGVQFADGGLVKRFADGGVLHAADGMTVPGYAPRHDIVRALLSPGEGVLVPEAVRQLGGERAITSINRTARSGGGLGAGASSMAVSSGKGGGGTTVIHHTTVHVHGSVLTEGELRDIVEQQYLRQGANNSTTYPSYGRR